MKKLILLVCGFVVGQSAFAQANDELNGLIRQSFNYFPRIKELNKSAELGEMKIDIAQTGYLPSVNGVGNYTYLNPISQKAFVVGPGETQVLKFQPYNNYNVNVGVSQLIWDFGRTKSQVEKAKADLLTTRQNIEGAKLQLAAQVASIYYSLIYLRSAEQVQDSVIDFYRENQRIIEGRIKQGDALDIDLSSIRNNIDQETIRKTEFQRQYDRQLALLRYSTGQATEPSTALFAFQPPAAVDATNNPDVLAANERIASSKADLHYAQANKLPSFTFQGGAGYKNGYQPDITAFRFNYLAGVNLNVPIFQGRRLSKSVLLANQTMELSELSKATLVATLQKDIESVQSDLKAYADQIRNSEGQIRMADEMVALTKSRYQQGVVTYLDLINSSNNLQRANLNKLQYEYQQTLAQIELHRLLGIRFWQE